MCFQSQNNNNNDMKLINIFTSISSYMFAYVTKAWFCVRFSCCWCTRGCGRVGDGRREVE